MSMLPEILLMAEILHHLGCMKPYKIMGKTTNLNWLAGFQPSTISTNSTKPKNQRFSFAPIIPEATTGSIREEKGDCLSINEGPANLSPVVVHRKWRLLHFIRVHKGGDSLTKSIGDIGLQTKLINDVR